MKLRYGNMWNEFEKVDLFLITTNNYIKKNGALVMGAGIAKEARDKFPGLDRALGKAIVRGPGPRYGLLVSERWPEAKLGIFQVKRDWNEPADLELIRHSAMKLIGWCQKHPDAKVSLNFPGIGNGGLPYDDVFDVVRHLPDQVDIWQSSGLQVIPFRKKA